MSERAEVPGRRAGDGQSTPSERAVGGVTAGGVTASDVTPGPADSATFDGDAVGVHRVRVRYCETDRMGVAHHGSYVAWFEEARTEWLRARGKSYREMEDEGTFLQVVELQVKYVRSVTYDDVLVVHTRVAERRPASIMLAYEVRLERTGETTASGATRLACVDRDGRVRRLPAGV